MIENVPGEIVMVAAVYVLAAARLTTLLAFDEIARPMREGLVRRLNPRKGWHRKIAYLVGGADDDANGCPWCLSVWVCAVVAPAAWFWHDRLWLLLPAAALAGSQVIGMIAGIGRR